MLGLMPILGCLFFFAVVQITKLRQSRIFLNMLLVCLACHQELEQTRAARMLNSLIHAEPSFARPWKS